MPMPSVVEDVRLLRYLGESGGHLHRIEVYGSDSSQFDVYEMEKDYSGWSLKYKVDLNPIAAAFSEMAGAMMIQYACILMHFQYSVVHDENDEDSCISKSSMIPSALFLRVLPSSNKPKYYFLPLEGQPVRHPFIRSLTFVDDPAGIKILQSCNGFLLCCSNRQFRRNYYIYNPTTKQYTTLPKPGQRKPNTIFAEILAFDPSKADHYKVVFVRCSETSPHLYQLEIYSSETQLWSFSSEIPKFDYRRGVYCCGSIHWMTYPRALLCFDVDQERFQEIPMPEIPDDWNQEKCRYFGEFGGHLHLILTNGRQSTSRFDVYEIENHSSRWFLKYQVDLDELILAYPEMTRSYSHPSDWDYHAFRVLAVVSKENEGSFLVLHIPGKAIAYIFKDKTSRLLHDFAPGCTDIEGCTTFKRDDAYPYTGTFVIV
ncbi:hypothetical protein REPUB_Repub07fG0009700 [Reevesia pubescens]